MALEVEIHGLCQTDRLDALGQMSRGPNGRTLDLPSLCTETGSEMTEVSDCSCQEVWEAYRLLP